MESGLIIPDMSSVVRLEPAAQDWDFPRASTGLTVLLDFARAAGVRPERALVGTGLRTVDLGDPDLEVTAAQELRVVRTLHRLLGEVGAAVGERYEAATFGAFGYALLSSRTVLDAMLFAVRFIDLSHAFCLPLADIIDVAEEIARLEKTLGKLDKEIGGLLGRVNNPKFVASAPPEVVEETRANAALREEEAATLRSALERLKEIS